MKPLTLDFETKPIGFRPAEFPPEPVGVSIKLGHNRSIYYAWGHPTGNNCAYDQARGAMLDAIDKTDALVCHNLPFDLSVLNERCNLMLRGHRLIDTQVLAFLVDPYAHTLALKPLAERFLGEPPDEQDAVREWLVENGVIGRNLKKDWAAHIWQAPGDLVGRYACGDTERTFKLMRLWRERLGNEAFLREMALQPILMKMERMGVPVNSAALKHDLKRYEAALDTNEKRIKRMLRAPDLDLQKGDQVAAALQSEMPDIRLPLTPTGRISTARAAIDAALPDGTLKAALMYDSSLRQTLKMFLRPWNVQIRRTPGRLHPHWHGTRNEGGGARTGRLSSSPNLQNLNDREKELNLLADLSAMSPKIAWSLPALRDYVMAPAGFLLYGRDYSQIELRATAHYEQGPMLQGYIDNPDWDLHAWVVGRVQEMFGRTITRRQAKNVGFGIIYGAGGRAISAQTGLSYDDSIELKNLYLSVLPSLRDLMQGVQSVGRKGDFITTLGGRIYHTQPGTLVTDDAGNVLDSRTYEYKLLNYLIQGSCADLMKAAMIEIARRGIDLVMSVHDEPVALMLRGAKKYRDEILFEMGEAMLENEVAKRFETPIKSDAYYARKWATKTEFDS